MGQAQSDPGISSEKKQEKGEKNKRGKSLGGFLCMFSCLTCVGRQDQQTKDIQICLQMVEEEPIIPPPTVRDRDSTVEQQNLLDHLLLLVIVYTYFTSTMLLNLLYCTLPPQVMEEERLLPLSGPLVLYVPVWRPVSLSWVWEGASTYEQGLITIASKCSENTVNVYCVQIQILHSPEILSFSSLPLRLLHPRLFSSLQKLENCFWVTWQLWTLW